MDMISTTQWWLLAGILLLILEVVTPAFFAAALAIGCFLAALASYFGASLEVSWLIFSGVSLITIIYLRPLAKKLYKGKTFKSNASAMIGRTVTAEADLTPSHPEGYVRLDGVSWKALLAEGSQPIYKGEHAQIVGLDSIVLRVKKVH